jgi:hypothetical protein
MREGEMIPVQQSSAWSFAKQYNPSTREGT